MFSIKLPDFSSASQQWIPLRLGYKRLLLPVALMMLLLSNNTRELTVQTLSDSFWAVSTYVALTLAIYHYLSRWVNGTNRFVVAFHQSRNLQVVIASLLGALPGCGGAIVVTTQFVSGKVGFGSLVAVLTATMGDAAFLLLASKPLTGLGVIGIGIVTGCITGLIVNALHNDNFMRPAANQDQVERTRTPDAPLSQTALNLQGAFWKWLLLPASVVAFAQSFQIDINAQLGLPALTIEWLGALLAVVSMLLWALTRELDTYQDAVSEDCKTCQAHPLQKAAQDTNFVSAWVILAFLAFELAHHFTGWEVSQEWQHWGIWMPAIGIVVGMLPGCGPQILITSLYLAGSVPLSTQLANAISNDGDALFPAIALAPKAALFATLYTSVPAIVVGYGYYWLFEL
ncbi:putative manganese transporter [Vibrio fluvialis]|uniref:putative manganese transporter n=1 Tax=Vibrio fluvialis TaxID=676 RepID=UPI001C9DAE65|nr:putative manganese transporter [Vibrio fluvialis]ELS8946397.1 putative manganese transporter [Vibrio fluvialis]MBY8298161.1 putative manganese transporter [Vibrio fluvialis]MCG6386528.1 putative manganese transporter [Vibrio fluvialis]